MRRRNISIFLILSAFLFILFALDLLTGSSSISVSEVFRAICGGDVPASVSRIVLGIRLPKALSAILAGAALSVSGLQMQTLFANPLAGPYVLGINSGASFGVAMFILGMPLLGVSASSGSIVSSLGVAGAAWIGAALILAAIAFAGRRVRSILVILVLGMMLSSAVDSVVQILQYMSNEQALKSFVVWTMGSLSDVTPVQLCVMACSVSAGLLISVRCIKDLNMWLLGETYSRTMGLNVIRSRNMLFLSTVLLAGTVTAFCGPVGFVGLAVPHVCRALFREADHRVLLPASVLTGASLLLLCDIVSKLWVVPINSITALLGIPVVVWVVLENKTFA